MGNVLRCFKWLKRLGAIAVMAQAACSKLEVSGSPEVSLRLPDTAVTFDASSPEVRSRFQVESDEGRYDLRIDLVTTEVTNPSIELRLLDAGDPTGEFSPLVSQINDPSHASLWYDASLACPVDRFPCSNRFEVVGTGTVPPNSTATGTLSVQVQFDESFHEDACLAIEPL